MARMHEGGYGTGELRLAGNCKKCKTLTMFNVFINTKKFNIQEQLNGSLCEKCQEEEEFLLQVQRDKKLEELFKIKKKWWEFWKD
jgi:hypothetical protein